MTNLNSRQRKMSYFIGIILLLGPIVYLGFPAEQNAADSQSGGLGKLAQMSSSMTSAKPPWVKWTLPALQ